MPTNPLHGQQVMHRIVAAAGAHATERGWDGTSMREVREAAGVSNGSLFHFFPTRAALHAAVLGRVLADHHDALQAALRAARTPREGVEGLVHALVDWMRDNPGEAGLFLSTPPSTLHSLLADGEAESAGSFVDEVATWLRDAGWTGRPGLLVVLSLWVGPAMDLARRTPDLGDLDADATPYLAAAAWRSLEPHLGVTT